MCRIRWAAQHAGCWRSAIDLANQARFLHGVMLWLPPSKAPAHQSLPPAIPLHVQSFAAGAGSTRCGSCPSGQWTGRLTGQVRLGGECGACCTVLCCVLVSNTGPALHRHRNALSSAVLRCCFATRCHSTPPAGPVLAHHTSPAHSCGRCYAGSTISFQALMRGARPLFPCCVVSK